MKAITLDSCLLYKIYVLTIYEITLEGINYVKNNIKVVNSRIESQNAIDKRF